MALYIKANPLVAAHLNVDRLRLKLSDGNYLLWQADMLAFGKLYEIPQICGRIGALPLQPWEARQEQDGSVLRPLPVATDDRFIMPVEPDGADGADEPDGSGQSIQDKDPDSDSSTEDGTDKAVPGNNDTVTNDKESEVDL